MTDTVNIGTVTASGTEVFVPLNKLKKSHRNARKTPHSEAHVEALAASIAVKGMLQNLVVEPEQDADGRPTGSYLVTIGEGRRLAQLLRTKRKQIKKSDPLVATASGVTTLAREPSGAWRKTGTALAGLHATALTTLPGGPGIFVGTHCDGVLFSEDGARWEERNSGLTFKDVYTVASVAEAGGITLYAGTQPAALFKSRDLGQSWSELPALRQVPGTEYRTFPEPAHIAHTKMMVFDPRTPRRICAAIEQGALLKTEDGGQS
jgi:hypothetical protein